MSEYFYCNYKTDYKFTDLLNLFGLQAQLDINNIPESMSDIIEESKDLFLEHAKISIKYTFMDIDKLNENEIIICPPTNFPDVEPKNQSNDFFNSKYTLKGTLLPTILKDCHKVCLYILTVDGYDKIQEFCKDDIMLSFFADAWGSAYAEAADNHFRGELRSDIENQNLYLTISHNPGQHLFPLTNQKVFFDILNPKELNLKLTESCLMLPSKSISAVCGISKTPQDLSKVSCDYCSMKDTCPSAYAAS